MRYLKKEDGSIYVWTAALAKRTDMTEVTAAEAGFGKAKSAKPETPADGGSDDDGGKGEGGDKTIDPLLITDKAELEALGRKFGLELDRRKPLKTLQAQVAEAMKA